MSRRVPAFIRSKAFSDPSSRASTSASWELIRLVPYLQLHQYLPATHYAILSTESGRHLLVRASRRLIRIARRLESAFRAMVSSLPSAKLSPVDPDSYRGYSNDTKQCRSGSGKVQKIAPPAWLLFLAFFAPLTSNDSYRLLNWDQKKKCVYRSASLPISPWRVRLTCDPPLILCSRK